MKYPSIQSAQTIILHCERFGCNNVVVSPGSRNAPLAIGFASNAAFKCYSIIDERSAGFFALGISQQSKTPTIWVCTSGSALLNYYPAISEAFFSEIPLIIISADRPEYKINIGDGQTIFQQKVFEKNILDSVNLKQDVNHNSSEILKSNLQKILSSPSEKNILKQQQTIQSYNEKTIVSVFNKATLNSKPVHVNVPFEEPLYLFNEAPTVSLNLGPKTSPAKLQKLHFNDYLKKKYSKILNSSNKTGKAIRLEDASGRYSEFLKSTLDKEVKTKKLKIVLDCGNGATYDIAPSIFWELGHQVVSINDKPNGKNINYNCGAVNVGSLCKKVVEGRKYARLIPDASHEVKCSSLGWVYCTRRYSNRRWCSNGNLFNANFW